MSRARRGFKPIELLILLSVLAIVAAIAIPNLLAARLAANEEVAIATLRSVASAQARFRQEGRADEDGDGVGEFGGLLELAGVAPGRAPRPFSPPALSGSFRSSGADSAAARGGYLYRVYLPDAAGAGVAEPVGTSYVRGGGQDADLSETTWCCYAWPERYGRTGRRTLFVDASGRVLACDAPGYGGALRGPAADAAFSASGRITASVDAGGPGRNPGGEVWRRAD